MWRCLVGVTGVFQARSDEWWIFYGGLNFGRGLWNSGFGRWKIRRRAAELGYLRGLSMLEIQAFNLLPERNFGSADATKQFERLSVKMASSKGSEIGNPLPMPNDVWSRRLDMLLMHSLRKSYSKSLSFGILIQSSIASLWRGVSFT